MECKLYDKCENKNSIEDSCDTCYFNIYADLRNNFKFNGEGKEPTQEELDELIDEVCKLRGV